MPKKRSIDKLGNPTKCEVCGEVSHNYVMLLTSPDPVTHEAWCDRCYTKAVEEKQK